MKLSGQKIKSCVRLKHCLKLIYGKMFGIFSRHDPEVVNIILGGGGGGANSGKCF